MREAVTRDKRLVGVERDDVRWTTVRECEAHQPIKFRTSITRGLDGVFVLHRTFLKRVDDLDLSEMAVRVDVPHRMQPTKRLPIYKGQREPICSQDCHEPLYKLTGDDALEISNV